MSNSRPNRIYIFDQPRTCSMLFHRLLSKHPQLGHIFHPFSAAAMYGPGRIHLLLKPHDPASDAQQDKLAQDAAVNGVTYAGSENELYENIENLERDGKVICLKDHLVCLVRPELLLSHGKEWNGNDNPTRRFSEDFLLNITHPIFLVRHPALMVRSFWESQQTVFKLRADDDLFMALTTLRWTSILYDWYMTHGIRPLVIDAYDTVYNTAAVMDMVCNAVGIDPKGIQYEWPAKDDVDWQDGHMSRMFMWKLQTSTGVQREDHSSGQDVVDVESEVAKWTTAWGKDVANLLKARVEEEMPTYGRMRAQAYKVAEPERQTSTGV